jgi:hypothetical protein
MIDPAAYASNPKDVVGVRKTPASTVPAPVMAEVGVAMLEGALKYGRHNYRVVGVKGSIYYDACNRHLNAWWEGEDIDAASRIHHLSKAIACLTVLRDGIIRNVWIDDRPPKTIGFMKELDETVKWLLDKYPNPVPPFTELSHGTAVQEDRDKSVPPLLGEDKPEEEREVVTRDNIESINKRLYSILIGDQRVSSEGTQTDGLSISEMYGEGISHPSSNDRYAPNNGGGEEA